MTTNTTAPGQEEVAVLIDALIEAGAGAEVFAATAELSTVEYPARERVADGATDRTGWLITGTVPAAFYAGRVIGRDVEAFTTLITGAEVHRLATVEKLTGADIAARAAQLVPAHLRAGW